MIPEEVLARGEVLGCLPDEYVDGAAEIIKSQEPEKIMEKVDQLFPKFSEQAADKLLRTLMMTGSEDVKKALYRSREVAKWIVKNRDMMMRAVHRSSGPVPSIQIV